jgi:hypothetical protein
MDRVCQMRMAFQKGRKKFRQSCSMSREDLQGPGSELPHPMLRRLAVRRQNDLQVESIQRRPIHAWVATMAPSRAVHDLTTCDFPHSSVLPQVGFRLRLRAH